ncbi:MAG: RsmG family class I SAM-dependent methyltransferase [Acidobacteriota bacterium]
MAERFAALVRARADAAELVVADGLREALAAYVSLLARWNRKINLTSFDLDVPTDAAIDRLVIEPLRASRLVRPTDRLAVDIGSGGGSPAIPLRLAQPQLETVLIEARERKAAFLREVARTLELANVHVEADTFERFAERPAWARRADLVTMRAVRPDESIWRGARAVIQANGRFLWFAELGETTKFGSWFRVVQFDGPVVVLEPT